MLFWAQSFVRSVLIRTLRTLLSPGPKISTSSSALKAS